MRTPTPATFALLIATAAAGPASAQTRPATPAPSAQPAPSLLATLQQHERDVTVKSLSDYPLLAAAPLADVVRLGRDGDRLQITSRLTSTAGQCRVPVNDLAGPCSILITPIRHDGDPPAAMPDALLFVWYQFDRPGTVEAGTTVQVLPFNLQLSRTIETPDGGGSQFQLTIQRPASPSSRANGGDTPEVSLKVTDGGGRPAAPPVDVTATSFADLCRTQPAVVARHLEPILRDLHADAAVLTPDPVLAYQVLAADLPVPVATADGVDKLVARLDADDPHDRDGAEADLVRLGPIAGVALTKVDPARLSPEQRSRTAGVVRRLHPVPDVVATSLRDDVDCLLNCLWVDDPAVVNAALPRLRKAAGHDVAFDTHLQGAARREAVWHLRQALTTSPATRP